MVDAMMTGQPTLAHVLVAATEVCNVCELSRTQQHVADAVACLAGEILLHQTPSLDDDSCAPHHKQSGPVYWNHKHQRRVEHSPA
jgi:hypothetical protein